MPYVYDLAILLRSAKRGNLASRDSAIVIEGFLRSGNTYSVAAFRLANGLDHHIGHHLHSAAHVLRAVRLQRPTVVLIREPYAAVRSYLIRRPSLSAHAALREYIDFYRSAWRAQHGFVVAPFERAVSDFGSIISAINLRFGTGFAPYEHTPENEATCFRIVEEMNRAECGGKIVETHVARPSAERASLSAALSVQLEAAGIRTLLHHACLLRSRYLDLAAIQGTGVEEETP